MWADSESDVDFLNYSEVAELIAELIGDKSLLPLSLGVFGGWGIGKSSTLNLVERELLAKSEQYLIVRFDAWLYQDFDDARAALMSVISRALAKEAPESLKKRAKKLVKRVNKLRLFGLAVEGGAAAFGFPVFGMGGKLVEAGGKIFTGSSDQEDRDQLSDAAHDLAGKNKGILRPDIKEPTEEITAFRREFGAVLSELGKTLVVFIDNLDRCLPPNTIHTLEAIRLFLFLPNTAFVIAADEDMVRHAVAQHFHNPRERHVTDYLDKLIQMPVFVPRPGVLEVRAYLTLLQADRVVTDESLIANLRDFLIERLRQSWKEESGFTIEEVMKILESSNDDLRNQIELGLRMAPLLAQSSSVNGNPRIVKRLMNVVRMRASIARRRGMPLDEAIIAKLALFERCTDGVATEHLQHEVQAAPDGKPALLVQVEAAKSEENLLAACPESWRPHIETVWDWVRLEPKLAGVDLRPAVYLARETVPMRIGTSGLSPIARSAVAELLNTSTIGSAAAQDAIGRIDPSEREFAMEEIVVELRKNSDWTKARNDVRGAVLLARHSADAGNVLARYLGSLPERPKWLGPLLKNDAWAKGK